VSDIPPQAIKTGMLCSAAIIDVLAGTLRALYPAGRDLPPVIIDPVTISTSGHTLLPTSAISALKTQIVPLGLVLTPNVLSNEGVHGEGFEAKARTLAEGKRRITDLDTMLSSARELAGLGCPNILLKGGHLALDLPVVQAQLRALEQIGAIGPADVLWPEDEGIRILESINGSSAQEKVVVDVLWESASSRCTAIVSRLISTENTHGTGCTLSAALAVYLGKGLNRTFVAQTALHHRRMC
jgi:hydroxymethylpyrimidine/phosphomethylpyrimidine kinase